MTGPEVERPGDWEPAWAYWASIAVGVTCAATAVALLIAWVTGPAVNP